MIDGLFGIIYVLYMVISDLVLLGLVVWRFKLL
jgi:hypothetical protein